MCDRIVGGLTEEDLERDEARVEWFFEVDDIVKAIRELRGGGYDEELKASIGSK